MGVEEGIHRGGGLNPQAYFFGSLIVVNVHVGDCFGATIDIDTAALHTDNQMQKSKHPIGAMGTWRARNARTYVAVLLWMSQLSNVTVPLEIKTPPPCTEMTNL